MKKKMKHKQLNEKGIASVEAALLLSIFVVFMTYCVGTFGVIHTGVLNSISARAYAFETFRNRANLTYFRDTPVAAPEHTIKAGVRVHGVTSEKEIGSGNSQWIVTDRTLSKGRDVAEVKRNRPTDDSKLNELNENKRETGEVNPVWIKTVYGMCLNQECGD